MKKQVYKNPYFSVIQDGKYFYIDYGRLHSGVVIIPIVDEKYIVMIKNYRFPLKTDSWELPRGFLDTAKEKPHKAAQRELQEETGYLVKLNKIKTIGFIAPDTGSMNNTVSVVEAKVRSSD